MKFTKVIIVTVFCIGFVLGSVSLTFGQGGAPPYAGLNYEKIALLKWYGANQNGTFTLGGENGGIAFDGANIWVADVLNNNLIKLRASDCAIVDTSPFSHGGVTLAFDGVNIWEAESDVLFEIRAADLAPLNAYEYAVTSSPRGIAFDGANIWVANNDDNTVTKLRVSDGNYIRYPVGKNPEGVAFDGVNIWVTNRGTGDLPGNTVTKLGTDGVIRKTITVGKGPEGVAFDGANIWVANSGDGTVTKLRASDGVVLLPSLQVGASPHGVAFDGANIWVTNYGDGTVTKLRASDGACLGTCTFPVGSRPYGVAFDGANIWVANGNGTVSKL